MDVLEALESRFGDRIRGTHREHGDRTAIIDKEILRPVLTWLRDECAEHFGFLVDLAGVDGLHLDDFRHRFEVVYHLKNLESGARIRIRAQVPEDDLEIDSITDMWKAANWAEREVYDMYGVRFRNHPNLKRILCIPTFEGHALRKDYDIRRQQWFDGEVDALADEIESAGESAPEDALSELIPINLGPAHPAVHGTLRSLVKCDGEIIVASAQEIGYLHRGFEKHSEVSTWTQVIPYTDRLNYCSAMLNNVAYCKAVEKLLDIEVPERTLYIRVIISEISRIIDHLVCLGAALVDLGALTNYWYLFAIRERAYEALEGLCGARLTSTYVRIGGVSDDLDPQFIGRVRTMLEELPQALDDVLKLVARNRIFLDRTQGVGVISREDALSFGWTGPCLRACGVAHDLRKDQPYDLYHTFDWEVATRPEGDTYARLMVRFDEIVQSMRIIEQALDRIPEGPVMCDDRRVVLPPKEEVYNTIEALMNHFVLTYEGIEIPRGEVYSAVEGANGELGFYLVSDGSGRPYRVRVRPPCFYIYSAFGHCIQGSMIPDAVAILGSLNIIAGELDR